MKTTTNFITDFAKPNSEGRNAAAWALIMENYDELTRYATHIASKTQSLEAEELLNASILTCLERFDKFDPAKGSGAKWAYWQTRRTATFLLRQAAAGRAVFCAMSPDRPDPLSFEAHQGFGDASNIEAIAEISRIFNLATPDEIDAVKSKAEGLSGAEVQSRLGITMPGRNQRIYRLRKRIQ